MPPLIAFVAAGMLAIMACAGPVCADAAADASAAARAADARHDYANQLKLLRPLAVQGDAWAQSGLGLMYYFGRGVPKDYVEAVRWFRKAAEQGVAWVQSLLGGMYLEGQGVPKDDAEAARWFRKTAEQGHADAQTSLGLLYEVGLGVPRDYVQAYMWFNIAAAAGDKLAAQKRDRIEHSMTVQQIAEGQRRTAAWEPKQSEERQAAPPTSTIKQEPAPGQLGTGFFIGDGVVLTNAHVVNGCSEVSIGVTARPNFFDQFDVPSIGRTTGG